MQPGVEYASKAKSFATAIEWHLLMPTIPNKLSSLELSSLVGLQDIDPAWSGTMRDRHPAAPVVVSRAQSEGVLAVRAGFLPKNVTQMYRKKVAGGSPSRRILSIEPPGHLRRHACHDHARRNIGGDHGAGGDDRSYAHPHAGQQDGPGTDPKHRPR